MNKEEFKLFLDNAVIEAKSIFSKGLIDNYINELKEYLLANTDYFKESFDLKNYDYLLKKFYPKNFAWTSDCYDFLKATNINTFPFFCNTIEEFAQLVFEERIKLHFQLGV